MQRRRTRWALATFVAVLAFALVLAGCGKTQSEIVKPPEDVAKANQPQPVQTCNEQDILLQKVKGDWNAMRSSFGAVYLSPDKVKDKLGDFFIVDLRKPADYATSHIPGAHNIPFMPFGTPDTDILAKLDTLPKDKPILVYCYKGQTGAYVTAGLRLLGYDAHNLSGGFGAWVDAKLTTEGAPQGEAPAPAQTAPAPSGGGGGGCGG
ncbi:rhodanese-like domain-containing protein [Brockia lithotrophica]|uniref:Rhodanese-related sulfurtransferase n=1 Tax=Brockia lithotrophica TaxID=933949 RepID=A0A660KW14_9BACL|nr:rhodanese-like domain-containing protein [Brockia lithotrophica]RKQ83632.1 rhodanese-related sulfurtransferase [Brockia lithotrophica]